MLHLRIDRPERRNSFTQDMYRALKRAAIWADGQAELDAVCLTGTDEWFGSGGDMAGNAEDTEGLAVEWDSTDQFPFRHIERCRKLWVAKVNGLCHAGGLDLTLRCDISVASDRARFRVPELLRGIPDPVMVARLGEVVGLARVAVHALHRGRGHRAPRPRPWAWWARSCPTTSSTPTSTGCWPRSSSPAPRPAVEVKHSINQRLPIVDQGMFHRAMMTPEMMEGLASFVQKRPPEWPRD